MVDAISLTKGRNSHYRGLRRRSANALILRPISNLWFRFHLRIGNATFERTFDKPFASL